MHYLGDGVYVELVEGMIKLMTVRENGIHYIYLEEEVYKNLEKFVKQLKKQA